MSVIVLFEEDVVGFPEKFVLLGNTLEEEAEAGFPEPEDLFEEDTSISMNNNLTIGNQNNIMAIL